MTLKVTLKQYEELALIHMSIQSTIVRLEEDLNYKRQRPIAEVIEFFEHMKTELNDAKKDVDNLGKLLFTGPEIIK